MHYEAKLSIVLLHIILTTTNLLIILFYCSNKKIILIHWILVNLCPSLIVLVTCSFAFCYCKGFIWYFPTSKYSLVPNICKVSEHPIWKVRVYYCFKTSFYFVYNFMFFLCRWYIFTDKVIIEIQIAWFFFNLILGYENCLTVLLS